MRGALELAKRVVVLEALGEVLCALRREIVVTEAARRRKITSASARIVYRHGLLTL